MCCSCTWILKNGWSSSWGLFDPSIVTALTYQVEIKQNHKSVKFEISGCFHRILGGILWMFDLWVWNVLRSRCLEGIRKERKRRFRRDSCTYFILIFLSIRWVLWFTRGVFQRWYFLIIFIFISFVWAMRTIQNFDQDDVERFSSKMKEMTEQIQGKWF